MEEHKKNNHKNAFSRMIDRIPIVNIRASVGEVEREIQNRIKEYETINYVYVVDDKARLAGVISIKEIFRAPKQTKIKEIMDRDLITVHPHTHQETVALLAIRHNLKAIPVIDKENKLLGAVPSDTILNILHSEHIEDALHAAGIHKFKDPAIDIIHADAFTHFQKRLPWLVLGLLGGILAAFVVGFFEKALEANLLLAAFIPTVVYIADAVGTQTETIFIRSLSLDHNFVLKKYLFRELKVALFLGIILGIIGMLGAFFWLKSFSMGIILAFSIFSATITAVIIAVLLPWLLLKLNLDPAMGSGPFATILTDILSILIYFGIATFMIGQIS